jgi:uncharacterized membrane protein
MSERVVFDAILEPNHPLGMKGLSIVIGLVAGLSFLSGVMFVLRGAWPVTPFFGADVLLLGWALRANARASHKRERVLLTPEKLVVRRFSERGRETSEEINPYWLRVDHDDPERMGAELALVEHGRRVVIGSFLGADERAALADALRQALREARTALPIAN